MSKSTSAARSRARRFALQALSQMQFAECSVSDVERQFHEDYDLKRVDTDYLHDLLVGIQNAREELDRLIAAKCDRQFEELDPVETAILRIGGFELIHRPDIPLKVVISEALELAHRFGASESHKFVNSVLDRLARDHRADHPGRKGAPGNHE